MEEQKQPLRLLSMASTLKVKDMVTSIAQRIKDGEVDGAKIGVALKKFAKLFEELNKDKEVKEIILEDTKKYQEGNKKTIELMGAKITIGSVRTWWEYHECGDPLWDTLDSLESEIKLHKKQREEQLQATVPKVQNIFAMPATNMLIESLPKLVWEESGEVASIMPPVKKSTEGLKYSV